jgi:hypothetical protein
MSPKSSKITAEEISHGLLSFSNLVEMELPPKKIFLHPWLCEKSITLISGWRGVGKTFFALAIANAITKDQQVGPWKTENAATCLYVDGELPKEDMQDRAKEMQIGIKGARPIYLYSNDYFSAIGLPTANLLNSNWRNAMRRALIENEIKLLIIDNLSSLAPGYDECSKEDYDPINQWLLSLRFAGISVILLHHVNKRGDQRGTSGREDNIDNSIILKHPEGYTPSEGCEFIAHFTKNRVRSGDHHLIADLKFKYNAGKWHWEQGAKDTKFQVYELLNDGFSQNQIAKELKLTAGRISQIKYEAVKDGILTRSGKLTKTGWYVVQN